MLTWITIGVCSITLLVCIYTLYRMRFIAANTAGNRKDILTLHQHDKELLAYVKQLNGEVQNAKKIWVKLEKQSK